MANLFSTLRRKTPSKRAMFAIAGTAVMAGVGLVQTTDTMAATTDAAKAVVPQIASQNFFPTPLPASISCSNSGTAGFRSANLSWPHATSDNGTVLYYRIRVVRDNNNNDLWKEYNQSGNTLKINVGNTARSYRVRVYVVSSPSGTTDANRVVSSGYVSHAIYNATVADTYCSGSQYLDAPNFTWENTSSFTPASPPVVDESVPNNDPAFVTENLSMRTPPGQLPVVEGAGDEATDGQGEAEKDGTDTTPATSSETPTPSPSESEKPSTPKENDSTDSGGSEANAPVVKGGIGMDLTTGEKALLVTVGGAQKCAMPLEDGDEALVGSNQVGVKNSKTGVIKTVDVDTCTYKNES